MWRTRPLVHTQLDRPLNELQKYGELFLKFLSIGEKTHFFEFNGKKLKNWTRISRCWLSEIDFRAKQICYSESASKTTSNNMYLIEKYFSTKFNRTPPQLFFTQFYPVVPHRSYFVEKYFSIRYMLFDVVFDADSE